MERRREDIHLLLDSYGVPRVEDAAVGARDAAGAERRRAAGDAE